MVSRNSKAAGALGQQEQQSSRCTWSAEIAKQQVHLVSRNSKAAWALGKHEQQQMFQKLQFI